MINFSKSEKHLIEVEKYIPLGSQTFSKSRTQFPVGISPLYVDRAKGAYFWDVDGNRFIDLVNGLASITLGHSLEELNELVIKQLERGSNFSLPGELEFEVARLISKQIPSIEMLRFGKNGSDATSAAVRLARAYTNRDYVAICGYHGWQDWYIGATSKNKGVPLATQKLTLKFKYNDIESLYKCFESCKGQLAAVVMEPMNIEYPKNDFLKNVQDFCNQTGTLFVLDETVTGYRFAKGGAQEIFDIKPDLTTLGKGIANGFPLSVIGGRSDVLAEMEQIFFSGTFGGELVSLTAAHFVLDLFEKQDIAGSLTQIGDNLADEISNLIREFELENYLSLSGHPTWKFLNWNSSDDFTSWELKTLFMQEIFQELIFVSTSHNVSLAMDENIQLEIISGYRKAFRKLAKSIGGNSVRKDLRVNPITPLFKVR